MGLFNKKEKVPDIPHSPQLPALPDPTITHSDVPPISSASSSTPTSEAPSAPAPTLTSTPTPTPNTPNQIIPNPPISNPPVQEKKDLPELPSFPATQQNENMNQQMVKYAVSDDETPEVNEVFVEPPQGGIHEENAIPVTQSSIPNLPSSPPTKPHNQLNQDVPPITSSSVSQAPHITHGEHKRRTLEITPEVKRRQPPITKKEEPIFIRIDKFEEAQKDFQKIKLQVKEIGSVLGKVKETKEKEEAEINSWTEDLEKLKARLAEIDVNIFNKI